MHKISICTQIKNRLYQFKKTFKENIKTITKFTNVEWIIVDINSTDELDKFIVSNISMHKQIHYYKSLDQIYYSIPVAKNFAVRLSTGDYVFNLDADNYLESAIEIIQTNNYSGIHYNTTNKGIFGRIGCARTAFKQVGGYDESFYPAGHHEQDLINRLSLINYELLKIKLVPNSIRNSKKSTTLNMISDLTWRQMNYQNKLHTKCNLNDKICNPNIRHVQCSFLYNFKDMINLNQKF
jgi:glycosyltransferase involved in cell wall biosynthesis